MAESPTVNWAVLLRNAGHEALSAFYREFAPRMYALAFAYCRDVSTAEDVTQSAFVGLVNALRAGRMIDSPAGYLAQAVRKRCISERRALVDAGAANERPDTRSPAGDMQRHEQAQQLWNAVAALPDEQREIVHLHISAGLTFEEAAKTMDIPLGTVLKRYYTALDRLKNKLKDMA